MSSILKDIKNLEDLRRRKAELRQEVDLSRRAMDYSLDHLINRGAVRKALFTAGITAAATFGLRFFTRQMGRHAAADKQAYADTTGADQSPWAPYLPLLRTAVDYLLDFLEERLRRGK